MIAVQTSPSTNSKPSQTLVPISTLVDLIRAKPTLPEAKQKAAFLKAIRDDEELLEALIYEWLSIKYSTAYRIAVPPSREEVRASRSDGVAQRERAVAAIKVRAIQMVLLDMVLPNGKPLRDCTGKDCAKAGGWLSKIAGAIKPTDKVGAALNEEQVRKFYGR